MQRIGSPETIRVDVRLICATHHDLVEMVRDGRFREDLYYRLKGVVIAMPSLKERREDIPELIDYFIRRHCARGDQQAKVFQPKARQLLIEYDWPGNVRQLQDAVQSLIDLTPSFFITKEEVENYLKFSGLAANRRDTFRHRVREYKRTLIIQALDRTNRNYSAAARMLALDPSNLRKLARDLELN
jgi:DNA-binding NtrC family response regulator